MSISHDALQRLDQLGLHHLRTLDAILVHGSVTQAAHHLGLTQSALSHQLSRLRDVLGDPLVVRGRRGMVPTPRALALAEPLRLALAQLEQAMLPMEPWQPSTARRRFRLAMPEHYVPLLLANAMRRLEAEAPDVDVHVLHVAQADIAQALEDNRIELAVGGMQMATSTLKSRNLADDELACAMRRDHPSAKKKLTLAQYCRLRHLLISPGGDGKGIVDEHLAALGRERRIQATTASFLAAPMIVAASDLVLTAPGRLLRYVAEYVPLQILKPPKALALPSFKLALLWHGRMHNDDGHRWLRKLISESL